MYSFIVDTAHATKAENLLVRIQKVYPVTYVKYSGQYRTHFHCDAPTDESLLTLVRYAVEGTFPFLVSENHNHLPVSL